jgi:TolB-like protein
MAMSYSFGFDELNDTGAATGLRLGRSVRAGGVLTAVRLGAVGVGAAMHGVSDEVAGDTASAVAADAGVSLTVDGVTAAAGLRNMGGALRTASASGGEADDLPRELRAAASYRFAPVHATVGVEYSAVAGRDGRIAAGAEWWPAPALAVRLGVADLTGGNMHLTLGLSAVLGAYGLDYALGSDAVGLAHQASLTYAFGPTAPELAALRLEDSLRAAEAAAALRREDALRGATEAAAPAVQAAAPVAPPAASRRSTLAVAQFDSQGVSASDAAVIVDMIRNELVKQGSLDIVEKSNMDKILAEQSFQQSGCTSQECAVKLGRILNVRYLVVGSFGKLLDQYVLSFRVVETETARIVYSDDAKGLSTQRDVADAVTALSKRLAKALARR